MEHKKLCGKDIVLFGFQNWDSEIGFNLKDMALELAKYNRVLFINRALDRSTTLAGKNNKAASVNIPKETLTQFSENIWIFNPGVVLQSINWIKWGWLYDRLNRVNNRRLADKINQTIDKLAFKNPVFINDNDFLRGFYLKELIPSCSAYIFYLRDFLTIQPYFKRHGERLEKLLIQKSDLVVANSAYLANYARQWNPKSYDIGQGCDFSGYTFKTAPEIPDNLKHIPRPIIGYCGAVTAMRLDEEIVEQIASALPETSIVLVGPEDDFFRNSHLKKISNIHFLGRTAPENVPSYIYHFDICINPQLTNPLTIGNYPRKIDEYLALGKPVVATSTDGMQMFKDYAFLCNNMQDYVQKISLILANPSTQSEQEHQKRKDFALSHTWEESMGQLGVAYYEVLGKN